jgi:predicted methyltransferase MtxX (methanogen marker protein 4)
MIPTRSIARASPAPGRAVGIGQPPGAGRLPLGRLASNRFVVRHASAAFLMAALRAGKVLAGVRGALAPAETMAALGESAGRAVLLEPRTGQGVLFGPGGVVEGRGAPARARFAAMAARALVRYELATEDPLIAVLAFGRREDASRGPRVARSLAEADDVVRRLRRLGLDAFNAGAQIEDVLGDADVVVAPDGASGNLAFRALHLTAGVRSYGALVLGAPFPFVDTSRRRASYEDPVRFASFLAASTRAP